ncbi:MAG: TlpA family protein disulfide reductase [Acidimicrobiia bacterium]|nr:TlpA family protein disulfide reductase [Acidimicrobiia bacterium]
MPIALLAAALAAAVLALACWFAIQLVQQNGRMLARIDVLERMVAALVEQANAAALGGPDPSLARSQIKRDGLERGTEAPDFRLQRLGGGDLSLTEFRGRPLLLVFSDPECGPCDALAPQLERRSRAADVQVLMVSRGAERANEAKRREHRLSFPIVLQRQWEISKLYAMFATPIAYLIDARGVVAAPVAKGPDAILGLLAHSVPPQATT